ncbi:unnamed protein product [Peniophora sp. CBMAI 1063]|nr:unnamed protein product [Peniophora sp. CBMAI 1063]
MPSVFRKLASLPRRLLCLPRRSEVDLTDDLPVTLGNATKDTTKTVTATSVDATDREAATTVPETRVIVAQRAHSSDDVADVHNVTDEESIIDTTHRTPSIYGHCSQDDLPDPSCPIAFPRRAIPTCEQGAWARQSRRTSPDNGTAHALRELSELAAHSPSSFVNTWRTYLAESRPTVASKNPHLPFLILMDVCAVNSIVVPDASKSEQLWSDMLLSGAADVCSAYLKRYPTTKALMVTGLSNVIICMHIACAPPKGVEAARASYMSLFAQYWKSIWEHRKLLTDDEVGGSGESASKARSAVHAAISLFFSILWRNSAHYSLWKREDFAVFRRVMLLVWMHSVDDDLDTDEKESYPVLASTLFDRFKDMTHFTDVDRREYVEEDMIGEYGAQKYLARACITICAFKDVDTLAKVHDVTAKTIAHPDFHPYLVSSGVLQAIRDTADVPIAQSPDKDALWVLHKAIIAAYCRLLNSAPVHQAAKPLLRTYDIFELIARASISFVSVRDTERYNCFCTVREVLAVYTVISGGAQAHSKKDGLVNTILQSLRPHWYRTIRDLRRIAEYNTSAEPRCEKVVDVWKALGATLGLKEEEEKVEFEKEMKRLEKLCAWKECQYHTVEPPTTASRCVGCREVRYCSKHCQQRDWKEGGHKLRCRRLKAEPHSPRSFQGTSSS